MQEIWCFFKLLEVLLGIACLTLHVLGFLYTEPLPHNLFYCGTFATFTMTATLGIVNNLFGRGRSIAIEAVTSTVGAVLHFAASLLSMYHAEKDFHLMFLTDMEEPSHTYFFYCKAQSIAALTTAGMYMLHATFAYDAGFMRLKRDKGISDELETEDETESVSRPKADIEMFVFGKWVHTKLLRFKWFHNLAAKQ